MQQGVAAALFIRGRDQPLDRAIEITLVRQDVLDLIVLEHAGQPVRAQKERISEVRLLGDDVDLHALLHAERAHDHVLVRPVLRLFRRDSLHPDVVVDQRVILGQLHELVAALAIAPRIADVPDDHVIVEEVLRDARGAHALEPLLALRPLVDLEVRQHDPGDHAVDVLAHVAIDLVRPGQDLLLARLDEMVDDQLDGKPTRDLATGMTTHAITDDCEAFARLGHRDRILVVITLTADIGIAREPYSRAVEGKRGAHGRQIVAAPHGLTPLTDLTIL